VKLVGVGERPDDLQPFEPAKSSTRWCPSNDRRRLPARALELAERGAG